MNFSNKHSEAINIFCNAISPLEMSRCAPYINLILVWNTGIGFGLLSFEQSEIYN